MITRELGVTYVGPDKMLFIVVQTTEIGAIILVLQDNPIYKKPIAPGTTINVFEDTAFWDESIPFASLPEGGKVSP